MKEISILIQWQPPGPFNESAYNGPIKLLTTVKCFNHWLTLHCDSYISYHMQLMIKQQLINLMYGKSETKINRDGVQREH